MHSARRRSAPKVSYLGRCPSSCHRITKRSQFSSQFAQSETSCTRPIEAVCRKLTPPGVRPKSALADTRTGVVRGDTRNEAIFPPNPHKRKPLALIGAKPLTRAQTGRTRELAALPGSNGCWRFARQDRSPILRYHWISGVIRETGAQMIEGTGKINRNRRLQLPK